LRRECAIVDLSEKLICKNLRGSLRPVFPSVVNKLAAFRGEFEGAVILHLVVMKAEKPRTALTEYVSPLVTP
jgi:hypothetical protein